MLDLLRKVYQFDVFVALETLQTMPSSYLYKTLKTHIKDYYPGNYRFLIVNNIKLQNKDVLQHTINTLGLLKIPNNLVLVVTDQEDVKKFFDQNDIEVKFAHFKETFPVGNSKPIFNIDNKLCPYAWAGFHIDPEGWVRPCCDFYGSYLKDDGVLLDASKDSFEKIINSSDMKLIREQFRKGEQPEGCKKNCLDAPIGKYSRYAHSKYKLENIYGEIDWESEGEIKFLNGHLSNLCNLGCVICNPRSSSIIAVEDLKVNNKGNIKENPKYHMFQTGLNALNENSYLWEEVDSNLNKIKNFELLGGEPFLNKRIINLIEQLISNGHSKDCILQIVTNGTQFPDICNYLHNFKKVFIHLSIDDIEERFEYERYLGKWGIVSSNIQKFDNLSKEHNNIKIHFAVAVSILNAYYLPELVEYFSQYDYETYYFGDVHDPEQLSLNNLTRQAKDALILRLSEFVNKYPQLEFVINLVKNTKLVDGIDFCKYIKYKDTLRNLNLLNTHKEIGELMGYSNFNN